MKLFRPSGGTSASSCNAGMRQWDVSNSEYYHHLAGAYTDDSLGEIICLKIPHPRRNLGLALQLLLVLVPLITLSNYSVQICCWIVWASALRELFISIKSGNFLLEATVLCLYQGKCFAFSVQTSCLELLPYQ